MTLHKACVTDLGFVSAGAGYCAVCSQPVHRVRGGRGRVWVHTDSGTVTARNPPSVPELQAEIAELKRQLAQSRATIRNAIQRAARFLKAH